MHPLKGFNSFLDKSLNALRNSKFFHNLNPEIDEYLKEFHCVWERIVEFLKEFEYAP